MNPRDEGFDLLDHGVDSRIIIHLGQVRSSVQAFGHGEAQGGFGVEHRPGRAFPFVHPRGSGHPARLAGHGITPDVDDDFVSPVAVADHRAQSPARAAVAGSAERIAGERDLVGRLLPAAPVAVRQDPPVIFWQREDSLAVALVQLRGDVVLELAHRPLGWFRGWLGDATMTEKRWGRKGSNLRPRDYEARESSPVSAYRDCTYI